MTYYWKQHIDGLRLLLASGFLALCMVGSLSLHAQVQRYPATVTPIVSGPYSAFLSDYIEAGSQRLVGNVLFHDYNEASWTFKLKLTIEGSGVRLETRPGFTPTNPITVQPGQPFVLSGSDWAEYFNYNNLTVQDRSNAVASSGRLPEGNYSFCLQVLDYTTGDPLSSAMCATVWIQLMDPPRTNSPVCGDIVDPATAVQLPFTWQSFNTVNPNGQNIDYQLTMWELMDPSASPLSAVANGQALQVFQSEVVTNTAFNYGPSAPLLEPGKTYIYQVQALDQGGKSYYKNNGYSEYCYFHYGYPVGGKITLKYPEKDAAFRRGTKPRLTWSSPDNMVPNRQINYEVVVKEMEEDEDPERAIVTNETWHFHATPEVIFGSDYPAEIPAVEIEQKYAWQVKAFSKELEIATSPVSTFFGPSLVEHFYAGNSKVMVDYITKKDLNDLAGSGRVLLSDSKDDWQEVEFEHLVLKESGGFYFLESGTITGTIAPRTYALAASFEDNGAGKFVYDGFKLDKDGIYLNGRFYWDLPFPVNEGSNTYLESQKCYLEYNAFTLVGRAPLQESQYDLFDPAGFTLQMSATSGIYINQEKFRFSLNGVLRTPELVPSITPERAGWAFTEAGQLGIIQTRHTEAIRVIKDAGIELHPLSSIIDLSDNESPGKNAQDPYWKGIYIEEADLKLPAGFDRDGQLKVSATITKTISHDATQETTLWVGPRGLNLYADIDMSGSEAYFNTFPAEYTSLLLDITNQNVNAASQLQGNLFIPFVDQDTPFAFESQFCNRGFRPGAIPDLSGTNFTFNRDGGDLALNVAIKKAEIVDKERIQMTLDLEWPSLEVAFTGVPNFTVWGNYSVGFFTPEGIVALPSQVRANFKTYPVTIDALSAGRNADYYGIAISGKVVMGDDVSGDDGPPAFNLYSLEQNGLLDTEYTPAEGQMAVDLGSAQDGMAQLEAELAALEADLMAELAEQEAAVESAAADAIMAAAASMGGQEYAANELIETQEEEPEIDFANIKEELVAYLTLLKDMQQDQEKRGAVDELIAKVQEADVDDLNSLSEVLDKLKVYAADYASEYLAGLVGADDFLQKVDKVTNDINGKIIGEANKLTKMVHDQVEAAVGQVVDKAASGVVASLSGKAPNITEIVGEIAVTTKAALVNEVSGAVSKSVNENVVFPLTGFITANLSERAHRLVNETVKTVVMGALGGEQNPSEIMGDVMGGIEDELSGLGEEVGGQVNMEKMLETIKKLGQDAIGNIDPSRVSGRIMVGATEAIANAVGQMAGEKMGELANNLLGDDIGIAVPVDFGAAAGTLLSGGSPKDLLFDPIPIKVRSPVLDINGILHFMKDHPIYGDGFAGNVVGLVKKPNTFEIDMAYINGRKEGVSFWMIEVGGAASGSPSEGGEGEGADMSKVGGEMEKSMKEPPKGLKLGPMEIMALRGRFYRNMSAEGLGKLMPDANTRYGAYLHMIMFGPKKGEKMRLEIDASMSTMASGDYTFSFDGNAQFLNTNPQVFKIDQDASIQATLSLKYNSAERHFFGYAAAVIKRAELCAQGSLLVDVKPGAWRVAIGSKEEKIRFVLACAGFGPTGWLDANQNTVFLGLGLEFIFYTNISLDVGVAAVGIVIDAGAAAGIQALIQYKPSFMIMEAGVWLELWARIQLSYKTPIKKGSVTLADVYVAADAIMRFNPAPTVLYGKVNGRVKVLFLNFGFDKNFEMNM